MKDLFVPYEQSLQLKELGFDEPCFGWYSSMEGNPFRLNYCETYLGIENSTKAPIFAQAFEFFREKYNLFGQVNIHTYFIYDISTPEIVKEYDKLTKTYKETELACLIKLIEITKNKL
jgi:hypothetical protein